MAVTGCTEKCGITCTPGLLLKCTNSASQQLNWTLQIRAAWHRNFNHSIAAQSQV